MVKDYRSRVYAERSALIRKHKDVPCVDCGIKYPYYVMDLDHVRGKKERQGPSMFYAPMDLLHAELAKCEVRCSNCHRLRHKGKTRETGPTA